jgi:hypothetical protein
MSLSAQASTTSTLSDGSMQIGGSRFCHAGDLGLQKHEGCPHEAAGIGASEHQLIAGSSTQRLHHNLPAAVQEPVTAAVQGVDVALQEMLAWPCMCSSVPHFIYCHSTAWHPVTKDHMHPTC